MINNPYIEKVKNHDKIMVDVDKIYSQKWKWSSFFGNNNPVRLEIWTGLWNWFSREVGNNRDANYIWMEIRYKRLYKTAEKTLWNLCSYSKNKPSPLAPLPRGEGKKDHNFILLKDFWENVDKIFDEWELDEAYIFFPDPWARKEKQQKHRLLQTWFLNNLYNCTKKWWKVIFKTDHKWYFDFVLDELKETKWKTNFKSYDYKKDNLYKNEATTEFEQIFKWQDLKVCYIELEK